MVQRPRSFRSQGGGGTHLTSQRIALPGVYMNDLHDRGATAETREIKGRPLGILPPMLGGGRPYCCFLIAFVSSRILNLKPNRVGFDSNYCLESNRTAKKSSITVKIV